MAGDLRTELHPDILAALEASRTTPDTHQLSIEEARRLKHESAAWVGDSDAAEPVGDVREYRIPGPDVDVPIRIYSPDSHGPFPVLLWLHGGGFVSGTLDSNDQLCRFLTNSIGCSVVAVGYRLAPEHPFPAALQDCYAALSWMADNHEVVRGDPQRIAIAGSSAGGNLTAATTLLARDRGAPDIAHQLLIVPALDYRMAGSSYDENAAEYGLTRTGMAHYWDLYVGDDITGANPYASPLSARDVGGLPDTTVVTAGFDPLRDDGIRYAERLRTAGVAVEHLHYPDVPHLIGVYFRQGYDRAAEIFEEIGATMRDALGADGTA